MGIEEAKISREFPATAEAVPKAREWVVEVAVATGHAPLASTVQLLVSELASNAVRHAGGDTFVVEFDSDSDHKIIVAVCDPSAGVPLARTAGPADIGGRGLEIVDKLADQWGVAVSKRGKCVWFQLDHSPPA